MGNAGPRGAGVADVTAVAHGRETSELEKSDLRQFTLDGVEDTGEILGRGSYAEVKELRVRGRKCAGKKIHALLFASASDREKEEMLRRFKSECSLLASLKHPNVVEFVGIHWERGSRLPVLVMEYLPCTLAGYIEEHGTILREGVRYAVLRDVAQGLRYLHKLEPPVVHRDLSANNVLLTDGMEAKISDLGVAKILDLTPEQMTQRTSTQAPGTPCYMPPEALVARPRYTAKLDIYSYGVLILHLLCGRWPLPSDLFQPDPQNPEEMIAVKEVDRRKEYLQQIGEAHPLTVLIRRCLHNSQSARPEASEILESVSALAHAQPTTPSHEDSAVAPGPATTPTKEDGAVAELGRKTEQLSATDKDGSRPSRVSVLNGRMILHELFLRLKSCRCPMVVTN